MDRIEQQQRGRLRVIRVNIQDPNGRELAQRHGFEFTPTFIFFDAQGHELWRSVGSLDPQQVAESLNH